MSAGSSFIRIPSRLSAPRRIAGSVRGAGLVVAVSSLAIAGRASPTVAQETRETRGEAVTGRVLDGETAAPIRGAFVGLQFADEGVFTDSLGYFRLPVPVAPAYDVVVEQLGYADGRVGLLAADLVVPVELRLRPDPVALEQLEVVADRFAERRNAYAGAVSVLDFDDLQRLGGQTAFDVALRRAGLRPCGASSTEEWCTFWRGNLVPPRVYIDERPLVWDGANWLRDLDARELYLLEVYNFGRVIRVLTRWEVEERPEQLAALRSLPLVLPMWEWGTSGPGGGSAGRFRAPTSLGF